MTKLINTAGLLGNAIAFGKISKRAAQLKVQLDFTGDAVNQVSINIDEHIRNVTGLDTVQTVYIDNSINPAALSLQLDNGQFLEILGGQQAFLPILFSGQVLNIIATSLVATGALPTLTFLNVRIPPEVWSASATIGTAGLGGTGMLASITALTAGGSSQLLIAGNSARKAFNIRNPALAASQGIAAAEPVYLQFGGAAAVNSGYELLPGESVSSVSLGYNFTGQINFNAATTGHNCMSQVG